MFSGHQSRNVDVHQDDTYYGYPAEIIFNCLPDIQHVVKNINKDYRKDTENHQYC